MTMWASVLALSMGILVLGPEDCVSLAGMMEVGTFLSGFRPMDCLITAIIAQPMLPRAKTSIMR